jgi:hypothetical protein
MDGGGGQPRTAVATSAATTFTSLPQQTRGDHHHPLRDPEQVRRHLSPPRNSPLPVAALRNSPLPVAAPRNSPLLLAAPTVRNGSAKAPQRSPRSSSVYYYSDTLRRSGNSARSPPLSRQDTDSGVSSSSWASSWHHNNSGESTPRGGEFTPRGGESTPRGGEFTPRGGELTPRGGEFTPRGVLARGESRPGGQQRRQGAPVATQVTDDRLAAWSGPRKVHV